VLNLLFIVDIGQVAPLMGCVLWPARQCAGRGV